MLSIPLQKPVDEVVAEKAEEAAIESDEKPKDEQIDETDAAEAAQTSPPEETPESTDCADGGKDVVSSDENIEPMIDGADREESGEEAKKSDAQQPWSVPVCCGILGPL